MLCGCRECRWLGGNAPEDHGSGLLNGFQALAQEIGVSVPKLDVVLGCGSVLKSDRLANHKGHGFGLGFADLFGGQGAAVATMEHFVSLCCRQHKPTYVALRFMWRSLQGTRRGGRFGVDKRHITFGSETAKEPHDARVRTPHLFLAPFPTRVTGCQRLGLHLKIDFGVDIGGVDGNMSEPRPDRVDVHAST